MVCGTSNFIKSEKMKMYSNINDNNKKKNRQDDKVESDYTKKKADD